MQPSAGGEESGYVAECTQLHAVTQGSSLDEAAENLREAVALALEGNEAKDFGLMVTIHLTPAH